MEFRIFIRNTVTGEEQNFADKQAIADFLAGREDAADWEGYQNLGELPVATDAAYILEGQRTIAKWLEAEAVEAATPAKTPDNPVETPTNPVETTEAAPAAPADNG
jgi:hypothetical protein